MSTKIPWSGRVCGVQPRIRLLRSFDQRQHNYPGFALRVFGQLGEEADRDFIVAIGKAAQAKHKFQVGDVVRGESDPVLDERLETAGFYKTAKLKKVEPTSIAIMSPPPFLGVPPELPVYRERGHRRLDARTFEKKCSSCIWGCRMAVEMIIDHWKGGPIRYRSETFCYGPKSCSFHKAGPTRKVPGRNGMSWEEEDWIDQEVVAHRDEDE